MNKMIQIRNVSERKHREIKARAAKNGMTLSEYISGLIDRDLEKPTIAELFERLKSRPRIRLDPPPAVIIREDRNSR
jgi:hypothetical protein